jgi:adenylate kinase
MTSSVPHSEFRVPSLLLLGPTGAGKTPLGEYLEQHGFRGQRCAHLDFGATLRAIAGGRPCPGLTGSALAVIRDSLETRALLENENFHIARTIVEAFISEKELGSDDLLVLNGLPRHVDQAGDVDAFLKINAIIHLSCTPEVVRRRIQCNSGGDRTGRKDDDLESVKRKLTIFQTRTAPILDHYRVKGVRIWTVEVKEQTGPEEIERELRERVWA